MAVQVKLLVGTRKGAWIFTSDEGRQRWERSEPMMRGWSVYHMAADLRCDPPRLYAAANHGHWGPSVAKSTDGGRAWDQRCEGFGFPEDTGEVIQNVWHVAPGHEREPGVVFAGTGPSGLFRSEDWGISWQSVDGINRHPLRQYWASVPGDQAPLHAVEIDPGDPAHMYVSTSGGGAYMTKDGGRSWQLVSYHVINVSAETRAFDGNAALLASPEARAYISQRVANVAPDVDPAAVFDMHCLRLDPKNPDRLWAQAHTGVFRSDDGGRAWEDVTAGLPSRHGFPIAVTRRPPDAAFVVPLEGSQTGADNFRVCPGQLTVYRTRDAGRSWERLTKGLPGPDDYQSVYREGLDTDGLDPEGVYVGTSNGQVYASADGGDHWHRLPGTLPPILSVTCAAW